MADVYQRLHDDVVSGELDPGEPLVETALAQRYGVSRTPVREALNRLEQDGTIERQHRSLRVRTRTPTEILEIYEVRITLEGLAAYEAAQNRTDWDLRRLASARRTMEGLRPPDGGGTTTSADAATSAAGLATANRAFHEALWTAGHNATLVDLLHRLHDHLRRYPETTLVSEGRWKRVLRDHVEMSTLIENRAAAAARDLAQRHMRAARDIRLTMFADEV